MNLDDIEARLKAVRHSPVSEQQLSRMLSADRHPAFRSIRRQLFWESVPWLLFLVLYYDFFDGHLRPIGWNIAVVVAVGLVLVHNLIGYRMVSRPIRGTTLAVSLDRYLGRLRSYAVVSILSRVVANGVIIGFLLSGSAGRPGPYYLIGLAVLGLVLLQLVALQQIWWSRLDKLRRTRLELRSTEE